MRQVPHYLLIGNGRVARHFQYYFSLLKLNFSCWHRGQALAQLQAAISEATHILLLISDAAIEAFAAEHLQQTSAICIHFSGSHISERVYGAHPLMTFNELQYDLARYQSVPFIVDHDAPHYSDLLPGLPNHHVRIAKSLKPKYHAYCVLAGNFSCLLWQKLFHSFEQELQIPIEMAHPFLQQVTENLCTAPQTALTGPLTRNDHVTIEKNMAALADDPFQDVYASFVTAFSKQRKIK